MHTSARRDDEASERSSALIWERVASPYTPYHRYCINAGLFRRNLISFNWYWAQALGGHAHANGDLSPCPTNPPGLRTGFTTVRANFLRRAELKLVKVCVDFTKSISRLSKRLNENLWSRCRLLQCLWIFFFFRIFFIPTGVYSLFCNLVTGDLLWGNLILKIAHSIRSICAGESFSLTGALTSWTQ